MAHMTVPISVSINLAAGKPAGSAESSQQQWEGGGVISPLIGPHVYFPTASNVKHLTRRQQVYGPFL